MNYKTRKPIDEMLTVNHLEDVNAVKLELDKLGTKGFHFFQWSSYSQPLNKPNAYKEAKESVWNFDELTDDQQDTVLLEWEKKQGNWFFVEAFSEVDGMKFLRGEGETFLECINRISKRVVIIESCKEHDWAYTHSNGHKTCKTCGFFAPCTIDEALANYKSGEVKFSKDKTLKFNHEKPLCPHCNSHKIYYLKYSMKPEMNYQCTECSKYIKKEKQYSFEKETYEERVRFMFCLVNRRTIDKNFLDTLLTKYVRDMYNHSRYVENIETHSFAEWFLPYFNELFTMISFVLRKENGNYKVQGITNFKTTLIDDKPSFSYSLMLKPETNEIQSVEDSFTEQMTIIADSLTKK